MTRTIWSIAALFAVWFCGSAMAAAPDAIIAERARDVLAVMQEKLPAAEVFDDAFLTAVPPAQLAALVKRLQADNGPVLAAENLQSTTASTATLRIRFERASAGAVLTIGPAGKISGFLIGAVIPNKDDAAKIAADFAALPGRAGFTVTKLADKPVVVAGARADEQFAIGSAFKLWVLDALAEEIAAGRLHWDQVVRLGPRSLPSGLTQDWPEGAAVTVETLATLMISRSDNTATDTLIGLVGRGRIGERVRATGHSDLSRMLPLLTTSEAFALKLGPPAPREAYGQADEIGQARLLDGLDPEKVLEGADPAALTTPTAIDTLEWFASPADIARVLESLRRRADPRVLQILAVASGLPRDQSDRFAYIGYKGGSEPGVLDLSWLVRTKAGEWVVVTASWNGAEKPLDPARLQQLAMRLIALVR